MEGVMMKNKDQYAVAVRKEDGEIVVEKKEYKGICPAKAVQKIPIIRGVINFIDSMCLGISSLAFSAQFFEEEPKKEEKKPKQTEKELSGAERTKDCSKKVSGDPGHKNELKEKAVVGGTVAFSLLIAIVIFMLLPFYLSQFLGRMIDSDTVVSVIEGILRLAVFFAYILFISRLEDIQRVFMYHGAEHKCINCIEHGFDLTVENVRNSGRQHKRCGTNFLFIVIIITVICFIFIQTDSHLMKLLYRIILIPIVAGVSYECIRIAGKYDNAFIDLVNKPGMLLQKLTTREPDDSMIEVGIASVEAVFDWRKYLEETEEEQENAAKKQNAEKKTE
ncbi:MAG: DUF1385 domain-containing protein [Eubacterium sp.]|nr:DUF1385 domain-containing protein [Eubacterium sp.]